MSESGPDRELGVLVVDDDHRLTEAISRYLSRRGYAVTAVNSGQLALDRFAEVAPGRFGGCTVSAPVLFARLS